MDPLTDSEDVEDFFRSADVAAVGEPRRSLSGVELEEIRQPISAEEWAHSRRFRRPVAALIGVLAGLSLLVILRQATSVKGSLAAVPPPIFEPARPLPNTDVVTAVQPEPAVARSSVVEPSAEPHAKVPARPTHLAPNDERSSRAMRKRSAASVPARSAANSAAQARAAISPPSASVESSLPAVGRFPDL